MSPRVPPPQAPPTFQHTPQSLVDDTRALIERSRAVEDEIVKDVRVEEATFDNVLRPMANDENSSALQKNIIGFYQHVSEDGGLRDASSTAEKELEVSNATHIYILPNTPFLPPPPSPLPPRGGLQNLIVPFCLM